MRPTASVINAVRQRCACSARTRCVLAALWLTCYSTLDWSSTAPGIRHQYTAAAERHTISAQAAHTQTSTSATGQFPHGPLRRIELINGDVLYAEPIDLNEHRLEVRWWEGIRRTIPRAALASIGEVATARPLLYVSFEEDSATSPAENSAPQADRPRQRRGPIENSILPAAFTQRQGGPVADGASGTTAWQLRPSERIAGDWPADAEFGEWAVWLNLADHSAADREEQLASWVFSAHSTPDETWTLVSDGKSVSVQATPTFTTGGRGESRRIPLAPGWHRLTLWNAPDRRELWWDAWLIAWGSSVTPLAHWELAGPTIGATRLDDLLLIGTPRPAASQRSTTPPGSTRTMAAAALNVRGPDPDADSDQLLDRRGERQFGQVHQVSADSVQLRSGRDTLNVPWSNLIHCQFSRPAVSPDARQVSGVIGRVKLQPRLIGSAWVVDEFRAALVDRSDEEWWLEHPYLGTVSLPSTRVARFDAEFVGKWKPLAPGWRHLGDQLRPDLQPAKPDSSEFVCPYAIDPATRDPALRLVLAADVFDLEPGAPQALPSAWTPLLRKGEFGTRLIVDQEPWGLLNDRIRFAQLKPQRIRIRLPRTASQPGEHRLQFRQLRGKATGSVVYDDFQLGRVDLEWEWP